MASKKHQSKNVVNALMARPGYRSVALWLALLLVAAGGGYLIYRTRAARPGSTGADPQPGLVASWQGSTGATTAADNTYTQGGQIVLEWSQLEPSNGHFCWETTGGIGSRNNCLNKRLAYFSSIGKTVTLQVNSGTKPAWIYSRGVELCGHQSQIIYHHQAPYDIPMYWRSDGTPNPAYFDLMGNMLNSLATAIRQSPYKDVVSGIRSSPNLVGTEFRVADPRFKTEGGAVITLTSPNCSAQSVWTPAVGEQAYNKVMMMYYNTFEPDVRPILREEAFTGLGSYNLSTALLAKQSGKIQPWFFDTHSGVDAGFENKNGFAYKWSRTGKAVAYQEQVIDSYATNSTDSIPNPASWFYWTILQQLDRGTSYMATFAHDIYRLKDDPEYQAAANFANKYAGYFGPDKATTSPGGWVAFAPDDNEISGKTKYTHGNFTQYLNEDSTDGSVGLSSIGPFPNCFENGATCPGAKMIGSTAQRFGRWARRTNLGSGHGSIRVDVDPTLKSSMVGNTSVNVTYLDCAGGGDCSGTATWQLDWGNGRSNPVTVGNTNNWITKTIQVPIDQVSGAYHGHDLGLAVSGQDVAFHMVELVRGSGRTVDTTPPSKPSGLTSPGQTDTGVTLNWTASTDNVGVAGYNVYRSGDCSGGALNATGLVTTLNYVDSGLSPRTSYTYSVKAYDTSGNASDCSEPITTQTQAVITLPQVPPDVALGTDCNTTVSSRAPLQVGSVGPCVAYLQWVLAYQAGYGLGTTGPGQDGVDGSYGDSTRVALANLQSKSGITPTATGLVDAATWSLIDSLQSLPSNGACLSLTIDNVAAGSRPISRSGAHTLMLTIKNTGPVWPYLLGGLYIQDPASGTRVQVGNSTALGIGVGPGRSLRYSIKLPAGALSSYAPGSWWVALETQNSAGGLVMVPCGYVINLK